MKSDNRKKTFARGKERALYILERSEKTERELRTKLKANQYVDEIIDEIIDFLKKYKYIDDYRYAERYIEYKSKSRSYKQIKAELFKKGISSEVIKSNFKNIEANEKITIQKLVNKKKIDWNSLDDMDIHKLMGYLLRKGFQYEQICEVIRDKRHEMSIAKNFNST